MHFKLEDYQERSLREAAEALNDHESILFQLPTGGGKTVVFSAITYRYINKTKKDVIIFVNRQELLSQTRKTINKWYGLIAEEISAQSGPIQVNLFGDECRIFVAMVETFERRAKQTAFMQMLSNVGLVIFDECHLGNFKKTFKHFEGVKKIGFTATPISSKKSDPLKNYYTKIIIGPSVKDLIEHNKEEPLRGVVQDITYCIKNVDRGKIDQIHDQLGYKGEDYNADIVGSALSNKKQIDNTVNAYITKAFGKKALCFNSNVAHSIAVTKAFVDAGLNAKHIDGSFNDQDREKIFKWFKETKDAILCNVGIATTGFDEPSAEVGIINKLTKSLTLMKQMCGRSARPFQYEDGSYKDFHIILDMGDNVIAGGHGEWSDDVDWANIFYNPKKPRGGVAPVKLCPVCESINAASARICKGFIQDMFDESQMIECGFEFPIKAAEIDTVEKEMVLISKEIDVAKTIDVFKNRNEFVSLFDIPRQLAYLTRQKLEYDYIDGDDFNTINESLLLKVREWCKMTGKRCQSWIKTSTKKKLCEELVKQGFEVDFEIIETQETQDNG